MADEAAPKAPDNRLTRKGGDAMNIAASLVSDQIWPTSKPPARTRGGGARFST